MCRKCKYWMPATGEHVVALTVPELPYRDSFQGYGVCHRYPTPIIVADRHWCGEFEKEQ